MCKSSGASHDLLRFVGAQTLHSYRPKMRIVSHPQPQQVTLQRHELDQVRDMKPLADG